MKKTFTYGEVTIPTINSKDALVPSQAIEVILDASDKTALGIALRDNLPALLVGETGTGKTSVIRQLAFLRQQPYVRVNMTGFTTPDDLIGSKSIKGDETYFEYGIITDAMNRGALLVLDEINATTPDCLFILHGLLDEDRRITLPNGEIIHPHPDFRVFATCNPDYEGTRSMNKAFLDRFPIILNVNHLSVPEEIKLIVERTGVTKALAQELVSIATMARTEYLNNKLTVFVSTRTLINAASLMAHGLDSKSAYKLTVMRKTNNPDEQKVILDFYLAVRKEGEGNPEDKYEVIKSGELKKLKQLSEKVKIADAQKLEVEQQAEKNKELLARTVVAMREVRAGAGEVIATQNFDAIIKKHGVPL
jgi:nitric oxide reductase NorQ protein